MTRGAEIVPIALTIAGSDPSGGAGIQADLKTFTALGVYGASVVTALTAQNTHGVTGVHPVPPEFIGQQLDAVAGDLQIGAVKTGMLGDRLTVLAVVAGLKRHRLAPLVVDPVMVATSGDVLLTPDAIDAVRRDLVPLAHLITPNLPEAARLLERNLAVTRDEMATQAIALLGLGAKAVLLKGGHGDGAEALDILAVPGRTEFLSKPRVETRNTHGTGCTLSAAITAYLAAGDPMETAARKAKDFVWQAIWSGRSMTIGHGAGPVDHMFQVRILPKSA